MLKIPLDKLYLIQQLNSLIWDIDPIQNSLNDKSNAGFIAEIGSGNNKCVIVTDSTPTQGCTKFNLVEIVGLTDTFLPCLTWHLDLEVNKVLQTNNKL